MVAVSERIPINLFHAFGIVLAAGGGASLTSSKRWPVATLAILDPKPLPPGMSLHLRHLYESLVQVSVCASFMPA